MRIGKGEEGHIAEIDQLREAGHFDCTEGEQKTGDHEKSEPEDGDEVPAHQGRAEFSETLGNCFIVRCYSPSPLAGAGRVREHLKQFLKHNGHRNKKREEAKQASSLLRLL